MLWFKLTSHDGQSIRVNMHHIVEYGEHDDGGGKTFLSIGNDTGFHIRETVAQIDDALINAASNLRLAQGW